MFYFFFFSYITKGAHTLIIFSFSLFIYKIYIVADNFGVATYAIFLFLLTIWWSRVWGDASACPYTHMEDMVEGKTSPRVVALKTWAQIMGGCCVYRFVQIFWWFEFVSTHEDRAFSECTADLQVIKIKPRKNPANLN